MKEGKKRGAERTQIATRDEEWSDERLKLFLKFYVDAGNDVNCTHTDGSTIYDLVSRHRKSRDYAKILKSAGALSEKT